MVGDNIKRLREKAGLTQRELAQRLQISPSAVGMYEQGRRIPDANDVMSIAQALGVSTDALMRNDGVCELESVIESMRSSLLAGGDVMFNGVPLTEEDAEAVLAAMKIGARVALEARRKQ